MKDDIKEAVGLLKEQNSRISKAETKIAVLEDRQPQRQAIVWGSGAGAFVGAIGLLIEYFFKK